MESSDTGVVKATKLKTVKAKTFGDSPEQKQRKALERQIGVYEDHVERVLEILDCDYKTFVLQVKSRHPGRDSSLEALGNLVSELQKRYSKIEELTKEAKLLG
jgi:hypothetical protein